MNFFTNYLQFVYVLLGRHFDENLGFINDWTEHARSKLGVCSMLLYGLEQKRLRPIVVLR